MTWKDSITSLLKVDYPIIQAPMLGVTTPEMVAAVCNEGALGSLPVGGLSPHITRTLIRKTKSLTNKPFAVNLFAHNIPRYQQEDLDPMRQLLLQLAAKRGYALHAADMEHFTFYSYHDQLQILLEEAVSIASFTFGCLDTASIHLLKTGNCLLIGTATSVEEARFLQQQHIDMVAVQGIEAGGHRGSFLNNNLLPETGLFALLPQVKAAVNIPCIAAGGINNAATISAAFTLGADAVQIGTAFIGTEESEAILPYKEKLPQATDTDTKLTKAFSGRWARGLKNDLMRDIETSGIPIPDYPLQNSLTTKLRKLASQNGDTGYINMWAGQSAGTTRLTNSKDVIRRLIEDYENQ